MVGMGVISFALVTILSVFNGFEQLNHELNNAFNPDITVTPKEGKVFNLTDEQKAKIKLLPGVKLTSEVLIENAGMKDGDHEFIATLKGVDDAYNKVTDIDSAIIRGEFLLHKKGNNFAVVGAGVERNLGINMEDQFSSITVLIPNRGKTTNPLNPEQAFTRSNIRPSGSFSIQMDYDFKYVFVPLDYMRSLMKYETEISALEVKATSENDVQRVKSELQNLLGPAYVYKDRYQQNETLYRVIKTEKLVLFAILSFVLAIAAFNIIGSLTMLVLEKSKDISILKAMGADNATIRRIFLFEGLLASLIGSLSGIVLAVVVCLIQIHFKVISLQGSGSFIVDAYPVQLQAGDFVLVLLIVVSISMVAAWLPARRATMYSGLVKGT